MLAQWRNNGVFTYEESSFLLLILSTSTVMVMPKSTPAASNKAITLMTSPVAICGSGFSAKNTHMRFNLMENVFFFFYHSKTVLVTAVAVVEEVMVAVCCSF